ncbi:hypothetical protein T439DRAFT_381575 [Meredithblackwellia eburnea MCA 4105]
MLSHHQHNTSPEHQTADNTSDTSDTTTTTTATAGDDARQTGRLASGAPAAGESGGGGGGGPGPLRVGGTNGGPVKLYPTNHQVSMTKFATSTDSRGFIPVYEYPLNSQTMMIDTETGYVHFTSIWKALGHTKADVVRLIEIAGMVRKVRGGYLKIQGTWLPYEVAHTLAKRVAYAIREDLVPLFGPDFPSACLAPGQPGFGQLVLSSPRTRGRRQPKNVEARQAAQAAAHAAQNNSGVTTAVQAAAMKPIMSKLSNDIKGCVVPKRSTFSTSTTTEVRPVRKGATTARTASVGAGQYGPPPQGAGRAVYQPYALNGASPTTSRYSPYGNYYSTPTMHLPLQTSTFPPPRGFAASQGHRQASTAVNHNSTPASAATSNYNTPPAPYDTRARSSSIAPSPAREHFAFHSPIAQHHDTTSIYASPGGRSEAQSSDVSSLDFGDSPRFEGLREPLPTGLVGPSGAQHHQGVPSTWPSIHEVSWDPHESSSSNSTFTASRNGSVDSNATTSFARPNLSLSLPSITAMSTFTESSMRSSEPSLVMEAHDLADHHDLSDHSFHAQLQRTSSFQPADARESSHHFPSHLETLADFSQPAASSHSFQQPSYHQQSQDLEEQIGNQPHQSPRLPRLQSNLHKANNVTPGPHLPYQSQKNQLPAREYRPYLVSVPRPLAPASGTSTFAFERHVHQHQQQQLYIPPPLPSLCQPQSEQNHKSFFHLEQPALPTRPSTSISAPLSPPESTFHQKSPSTDNFNSTPSSAIYQAATSTNFASRSAIFRDQEGTHSGESVKDNIGDQLKGSTEEDGVQRARAWAHWHSATPGNMGLHSDEQKPLAV